MPNHLRSCHHVVSFAVLVGSFVFVGTSAHAQHEANKQVAPHSPEWTRPEVDQDVLDLLRELITTGSVKRTPEELVVVAAARDVRRRAIMTFESMKPAQHRAPDLTSLARTTTATTASATIFTVNSGRDEADSGLDGSCYTGFHLDVANTIQECTLRAAIEEANGLAGIDSVVIRIDILSVARGATYLTTLGGFVYDDVRDLWTIPVGGPPSGNGQLPTITRNNVHIDGTWQKDGSGVGSFDDARCGTQFLNGDSSIVKVMIDGLLLPGAENVLNITGDDVSVRGVAVSNAPGHGIRGLGSDRLNLECLHVGTDHLGKTAEPNLGDGIVFKNAHRMNLARSLVSGNGMNGLTVLGDSADVTESFFGTDRTGAYAIPNAMAGLHLGGNAGSVTMSVASGNMIGIIISGNGNRVEASGIGVNRSASASISNTTHGVYVGGDSNSIGGSIPSSRSYVSGNLASGVFLADTSGSNTVANAWIGTNLSGTTSIPNNEGVTDNGATNQIGEIPLVGPAVPAPATTFATNSLAQTAKLSDVSGVPFKAGTVISGNVRDGVVAYGTAAIYGAHLGTDPTGTLAVPNGICGVYLGSGHDHTVGGLSPGSGNLISGNTCGVQAEVTTRRGVIVSNKIGTDISGTIAIPNLVGIRASNDSVGSGINIAGNLVSGNTNVGIENFGLETRIVGNFVGTDVSGTAPLPNFRGIILWNPGTAVIGGTGLSDPNTIAYNTREGVIVWSGAYGAAHISRNSIFGNGRIGIDLGGDGVTYNDAPYDDDLGPNGLQNFPTIVSAVLSAPDSLTVSYEFQSDFFGFQYEIEFFVSSTPDATGFGEGQKFVASQTVHPILGYVSVTDLGLVSPSFKTGLWLTMTATSTPFSNETSEFSEAVQITGPSVVLAAAKVFLEGPYAAGSMSTALLGGGLLPINQPFADPLFDGTLSEYDDVVAVPVLPENAVDWVTLSLRSDPSAGSEVQRRVAFVRNDGILMDFDGSTTVQFPDVATLDYYLVVCQRNHICAMSSSPVDFVSTGGIGTWDFTTAMTQAYTIGGAPMKHLGGGVYGLFAADNNVDGQVTAPDFNQWNAETTAGAVGYRRADHNLDGLVTAPDFNLWNANTTAGASSKVPN